VEEKEDTTTEEVLKDFIKTKMKMGDKADELNFERVHRAGPLQNNHRPRKIVAKFSAFKQREEVRGLAKNLKDTNYFVNEQFPPEIVEQRKKLLPTMKKARSDGKKAYISYNKLYIDGKLWVPKPNDQPGEPESDKGNSLLPSAKRQRPSTSP
jgi:hypothetical protein